MSDRLTRSRADRMLLGVAAGIARWLGVDPALVRITFVALSFVNGIGAVAYVILAVVLPADDAAGARGAGRDTDPPTTQLSTPPYGAPTASPGADAVTEPTRQRRAARARQALGGGIALVGLWLLARQLGLVPDLQWSVVAPLALIVVGFLLLAGRGTGGRGDDA